MSPIILLADKHAVVIDGLKWFLHTEFGITQIYETSTLSDIMALLKRKRPTHLITDVDFCDGNAFGILPNVSSLYQNTKTMVFVVPKLARFTRGALRSEYGIRHFISKSAGRPELKRALTTFFYDIEPIIIPDPTENNSLNPFDVLTPREKIAAFYIMQGISSNEIAYKMGLKQNTISRRLRVGFLRN